MALPDPEAIRAAPPPAPVSQPAAGSAMDAQGKKKAARKKALMGYASGAAAAGDATDQAFGPAKAAASSPGGTWLKAGAYNPYEIK